MTERDPEDLLWRLPARDPGTEPAEAPSAEDLNAFREQRLERRERERLARHLATRQAERDRLLASAGVARRPSPELRQRVLARVYGPPRARPAARWLSLAAALLALAIGLAWWPAPDPALPAHRLQISGLATDRADASAGEETVEVYPDTRLVLTLESEAGATADLIYGVYRRGAAGWERLPANARVERLESPGALRLTALASELLGASRPGSYTIQIVVARRGELPPAADLATGEISQSASCCWLAYSRDLRILPPATEREASQ
ncbi:MAG: hypothetical protein AAF560_25500 [Acidobacteriota bacterium]